MLIMLMMGFARDAMDATWLRHDIAHASETVIAVELPRATSPSADAHDVDGAVDDVDHQLLHAAIQLQVPMLVGSVSIGAAEPRGAVSALPPRVSRIPAARLEPPFRPPRTTANLV